MITVLRAAGLRFVIYLNDHEPAHLHVYGDGKPGSILFRFAQSPVAVCENAILQLRLRSWVRIVSNCSTGGEKSMGEFTLEDRVYSQVSHRGEVESAAAPRPVSVRFDRESGRIVVEFANGAAFMVPARQIQGLEDASPDEIANVELLGETGLHWEELDVDLAITGLMQGIFGTARFMDAARRGGQSRSDAKVAASRANGQKGGRPKKAS